MAYRTAPSLVPINQFAGSQASRVFERLHQENQLIVLKDDQPAAVILSPKEFSRLSEIEDYQLLLEANRRLANNIDTTTLSREQLMRELNITEAEIANAKDVVIE